MRFVTEQFSINSERLIVVMPSTKSNFIKNKIKNFNYTAFTFSNFEKFLTANGAYIKDHI